MNVLLATDGSKQAEEAAMMEVRSVCVSSNFDFRVAEFVRIRV